MILWFDGPKLEIKLTCQMPVMHFQPRQKGATLRASEVKPKLDRYIISKLGKDALKKHILSKDALNYKLSFLDKHSKSLKDSKIPMYYGKGNELFFTEPNMKIICFDAELQKILLQYIEDFFIVTNFGTVQGKGFGSFTIGNPSQKRVEDTLAKEFQLKKIFKLGPVKSEEHEDILNSIRDFYQLTKSGINFNNKYQRSSLFCYMHENGIDNEKAELKQQNIVRKFGSHVPVNAQINSNPQYVRAMLGVGSRLMFRERNMNNGSDTVLISNLASKHDKIERFASPLTFKVINKIVYIIPLKTFKSVLDKSFEFKNKVSGKRITLQTPNHFDMNKFLDYAVKQYNANRTRLFRDSYEIISVKIEEGME